MDSSPLPLEFRAWSVSAKGFPGHEADAARKLRYFANYAVLAPSGHNSQPWAFRIEGDTIELRADRRRALAVADPHDRELTMACACALFNLRLAAHYFGYALDEKLLPDSSDQDVLARARLGARADGAREDAMLFKAITRRRTNRMAYEEKPLDEGVLHTLERVVSSDHAWLQVAKEISLRHGLAELVAEGDRMQFHDASYRRELAAWLHPTRAHSRDGMPGYSYGLGEIRATIAPWIIRHFDVGSSTAKRDHARAEFSPALAVIGTTGDSPEDWLHAGLALQHVLLHATAAGLSASLLNQPIQVAALRPRVADLVGRSGYPQALLRLGHGPEIKPTPRRPVDDVVEME